MRHTRTSLWVTFCTMSRCMSTLVVCVTLMLALTSSFYADSSSSNDVMILTTENFDVAVAETAHLFVHFCK